MIWFAIVHETNREKAGEKPKRPTTSERLLWQDSCEEAARARMTLTRTTEMFRIHIQRSSDATILIVEGKVTGGARGEELERCWLTERSADPAKPIVVRLAAVAFVDADGRKLLSRMRREGTRLEASGCLMHAILLEIEEGFKKSGAPKTYAGG